MRARAAQALALLTVQLVLSTTALAAAEEPFTAAAMRDIAVRWDRASLTWPQLPAECAEGRCTLLLEVELQRAKHRPALRLHASGRELSQAFGAQARGRRWINVSTFFDLPSASQVELETTKLSVVPREETRLLVFFNPDLTGARVLVLAPHPDDAEIAAFGLYMHSDADVVTVTAGDAGGFNYRTLVPNPQEHYRLKGRIRTWDSITVPFLGGVDATRARNLGYYDATLSNMWRSRPEPVEPPIAPLDRPDAYRLLNVDPVVRARPMQPTWPSLVNDLVAELERVKPDFVAAPHPFLDAHGDHKFTTIALLEALEQLPAERHQAITLLLYTNHMVGAEPWPFGPREAVVGPPPLGGVADAELLELDAVFSLPLDEATRARKVLALEMMHDLRPLDLRDPKGAGEEWREAWRATRRSWSKPRPDYSYFRRGPRPNELFFVLGRERAAALKERFLQRAAQGELSRRAPTTR